MTVTNLYLSSHITGTISTPTNALGAPNSTWTTDTGNSSWTSRFACDNPPAGQVLSGTQTVTVRVRKQLGTGNPTLTMELWENGVFVSSFFINQVITSLTGEDVVGFFSAGQVTNPNNVEIFMSGQASGGGPSARAAVQIDGVTWAANHVAAGVDLVVVDSAHAHAVDSTSITQAQELTVTDVTHDHTVDATAVNAVGTASQTFNPSGSSTQTFVVPVGVTEIIFDVIGAEGGDSNGPGAAGGRVQTTLAVTPGETLHLRVGTAGATPTAGFFGGAAGGSGIITGGGGGGASDVRQGGTAESNRVIVAGGGGGGSSTTGTNPFGGGVNFDDQNITPSAATVGAAGGIGTGGGGGGGGWRGGTGGAANARGTGGSSMVNTTVCSDTTNTATYNLGSGWITLVWVDVLVVAEPFHGHSVDNVALTQVHSLVVTDAVHGHVVDSAAVFNAGYQSGYTGGYGTLTSSDLVVSDSSHEHTAEGVSLTQDHTLADVADSTHSHAADNVVLTQAQILVVADTFHAHRAVNRIISRPNSDVDAGLWSSNTGGALWDDLDEPLPHDFNATRIIASGSGDSGSIAKIGLSDVVDPGTSLGHMVRVSSFQANGTGSASLLVELRQGATLIATVFNGTVPNNDWATNTYVLTAAEADAITDYTDLQIWFTPTLTADAEVRVSQVEFEVGAPAAATKTFSWLNDAEGFVDFGLSSAISALRGSSGDPPGCARFTTSSVVTNDQEIFARNVAGQTWETWGVPVDAPVTHVKIASWKYQTTTATTGLVSHKLRMQIIDSGAGAVTSDVTNSVLDVTLPTGGDVSFVAGAPGSAIAVNVEDQASDTDVRLYLWLYDLNTSGTVLYNFHVDEVGVEITHVAPRSEVALTQVHTLVTVDAAHEHTADNVALTQIHSLVGLADCTHEHTSENVVLADGAVNLVVADAFHDHNADAAALTQQHVLVIADTGHDHTTDNVVLTQVHSLVVSETLHDHTVESVTLAQVHALAGLADSFHDHSVETFALTQGHVLALVDAFHDHAVDAVALAQDHSLVVVDAEHLHTVDVVTLAQDHFLAGLADCLHAHTVETTLVKLVTIATLYADAHLAGTVSTPANALNDPDDTWTTDTTASWASRFSMEDPPVGTVLDQLQTVSVQARKAPVGSGTPTITVELWEDGVFVKNLVVDELVSV